jgi:hypothetical protein
VFTEPSGLPLNRFYDHHIPLIPNVVPVNSRPCRYSPLHKDEIEKQVKELLSSGKIVPSNNPFAYPILLVQKKRWYLALLRRLPQVEQPHHQEHISFTYFIDEILDELAGTQYFTKLDMCSSYHQVRMHPEDEFKTAFKTHHGHFQFWVMPFGLTNAPATFQCLTNDILAPFL